MRFSSSEIMPTPCFCPSLLRDGLCCCGKQTGLLLISVVLEDFQKNQRGCTVDSRDPKCARTLGVPLPGTRSRCLGRSGTCIALEGILPWCLQLSTAVGATIHHRGAGLLQHRCGAATPRTHKAWKDIKGAHASAMALSSIQLSRCSEPHVHPVPQALLEKSFIRSGAGWAQRCRLLSWHTTRLGLTVHGNAPSGRKVAEVMRAEEWLAHGKGLY